MSSCSERMGWAIVAKADPGAWFLTREERGNPASDVQAGDASRPSWSEGNLVRPLVHGATYFERLYEELSALRAGDRVWFTDWRGDKDERLRPDGPTIGELLAELARSGVQVRGLVWRSHGERVSAPISSRSNARLGREINDAGGEVLLDQRVRRFGSHHQKLFVLRRSGDPSRDVAFVGGIDLSHSRRDDAHHGGDPEAVSMDARYGKTPPWHDAALELRGPVVADLLEVFAERWNDPHPLDHRNPYRMLLQRLADMPRHPRPLPEAAPAPAPAGPHAVQLLRTYGPKRPPFPFAPHGERSIAHAYAKAIARAQSLIYIEDQYLWSTEVVTAIADALRSTPTLQVIVVLPRYPDSDGLLSGPPRRVGQLRALAALRSAAPDRFGAFDLENGDSTPDLRPREALHHRRRLDDLRVGQLQPSLLDDGQRAHLRRRRHHAGRPERRPIGSRSPRPAVGRASRPRRRRPPTARHKGRVGSVEGQRRRARSLAHQRRPLAAAHRAGASPHGRARLAISAPVG